MLEANLLDYLWLFLPLNSYGTLDGVNEHSSWVSMILTLTALTPAAADTLTVVINRLLEGKSPMVGGKDHTTHHLVYAGFKDKQVWIIFSVIGFISFVLSVLIVYLSLNNQLHYTAFFILYFLIFSHCYIEIQ